MLTLAFDVLTLVFDVFVGVDGLGLFCCVVVVVPTSKYQQIDDVMTSEC